MRKSILFVLVSGALLFSCRPDSSTVDPFNYVQVKDTTVSNGAVASAHPLASAAGAYILRKGGNAVDAAIATQFALAVVFPEAGNIGGGGFTVIRLKDGTNITIDYREKAPGKAFRDMYLDSAGNPLLNLSQDGHLASGVPGAVAGMFAALKYGTMKIDKLIQPAIDLAEKGFAITASEARGLNRHKEDFLKYNTVVPAFVREDREWQEGDTLIQTDLANTLKRIKEEGAKGFYEGETAKLIVEEMERGGGIISYDDLKNYEAKEREPILFDYKGYEILTMPLPSSGGIIVEQMLKTSKMFNLDQMKFNSAEAVNLMAEIERRSFADRGKYLGDPDFYKVPVKALVNEDYLKERMADFVPGKAGNSKDIKEGFIPESEETTHYSVIDKDGNAVSTTTTINGGYGSRVVVGHAGFLMNNEMDDFSVKPGVPNMFGAVGQEANAVQANKRMLSSMTPTIILKDGKPWAILGTPGGTTIITSVYQTIVDLIDFKMSAHDAVNKPKFHHQWLPDVLYLEKGFDENVQKSLEAMGYTIKPRGAIGRTEVILVNDDGTITAVADRRGDDSAAGY
ncbi:MAG: gamma-glutamyltransferase [Chitinophagaceae bacterium]|nr:gamma-glutamyltransferase [Chitinophagaceae bacterium]